MADANQQLEELAQQLERINYQFNRYGRVMEDAADELAAGSTRRARELKSAADKTVGVFTNLTGAVSSGASAMLAGQKGASAFNSSIDGMASAATAAGTALALLAPAPLKLFMGAVTATIAPLSMLAKASANMADQLYKGYAGLARSGAAASDGMTGLREDARNLGLSMEELGEMVNIVAANSQNLAVFGNTVFEGRRRVTELIGELEPLREQFIAMGLSMTDVFDATVGYTRLLTLTGQSQTALYDDAAGTIRDYLFEVDKLTKVTGLSRKEQEQARESALSEQRFAARLEELRQQGADGVRKAQMLEKANLVILARAGKQAAQGFRDIQTNNLQTEAAQQFARATQFQGMRISQEMVAEQISMAKGTEQITKLIGQTARTLGPTLGQIGVFDKFFGPLAEGLRAAGSTTQDFEQAFADAERQLKGQIAGDDKLLAGQTQLIGKQIDANQALLDLVQRGIGPTQTALEKFTEVITDGTEALDRALEMLGIGAPKAARREDQAALDRTNKALEALPAKITKANEDLEQAIRDQMSADEIAARRAEVERLRASQPALERQVNMLRKGVTQQSATQAAVAAAETDTMMSGVAAEAALPVDMGAAPTPSTEQELRDAGIKIKYGDVQREGSKIQQNLIDIAQQIQESVPGFRHFSSFNDRYHQDRNSLHNQGRALDFVLNKDRISKEEGEKIAAMIRSMGASSVRDEYNDPSDGATGPHIHVEVPAMAKGGVTEGVSIAGEAGPEAVVPLPDGRTIPVELKIPFVGPSREQLMRDFGDLAGSIPIPGLHVMDAKNWAIQSGSEADQLSMAVTEMISTNRLLKAEVEGIKKSRGGMLDIYDYMRLMVNTPEGKVWAAENYIGVGYRDNTLEGEALRREYSEIREKVRQQEMAALAAGKLIGPAVEDPLSRMAVLAEDYIERQAYRIERGIGGWQTGGTTDQVAVINDQVIQELSRIESNLHELNSLPKMADGGITQGPSIAGEAGPEAVIPMDGRTIPVEMKGVEDMLNRLTRLVELQSENNRVTQQMYQASMN